jgi:hypothetical protein
MQDPSGLGLAAQEVMTKLPLSEEFSGAGSNTRPPALVVTGATTPVTQAPVVTGATTPVTRAPVVAGGTTPVAPTPLGAGGAVAAGGGGGGGGGPPIP